MLSEPQSTYPELYEEEGILRPFSKKLLQSSFLLWEFVINLTNVHRLQQGIAVGVICLTDVYKKVLVVLRRKQDRDSETRNMMLFEMIKIHKSGRAPLMHYICDMFMLLHTYELIKAKGLKNERCHLLSIVKLNRLENADKLRRIAAVTEIIKNALLQLRVDILRDRIVFGLSLRPCLSPSH